VTSFPTRSQVRKWLWFPLALFLAAGATAQDLRFATLGDFKLQSGEVLRDCRIGYRTWGQLNADQSNAVLWPMWASGTTDQMLGAVGPGKLLDSSKHYVIAIDPLTNGVSSSPSNSASQPRMQFPKITIHDMVDTEYRALTQVLHVHHLKAVLGVSMGGMQTFQWMVSYPDFMDKAVPIVGSPRLASYDLLLWKMQIDVITHDPGWKNGDYAEQPAKVIENEISALVLTTPQHYDRVTKREAVVSSLDEAERRPAFDANNHIRQAQAMMSLDISDAYGGSLERAAEAVKAKVFVVVSKFDHTVTPGPALEFAKLLHASVLEVEGDCGHLASSCESATIDPAVKEFLEKSVVGSQ